MPRSAFAALALAALLLAPGASGGRTAVTGRDNYGPVWSPDGSRLVFTSRLSSTSEIWLVNADGSGMRDLRSGEPLLYENPSWSPDGNRIVFTSWDISSTPPPPASIWVENVDGPISPRMIARTDTPEDRPQWSSQNEIAYTTAGEVHVVSPDGVTDHIVAAGRVPTWAPDGSRLAFVRGRELWVVNADGSDPRRLVGFDAMRPGRPVWSPHGDSIAFQATYDAAPAATELWRVDLGTGLTDRLALVYGVSAPSWSPDGAELAFSAAKTYEDFSDIYLVDRSGARLRNLTHDNGIEEGPAWASSNRLAFSGWGDVFSITAAGTKRRNLTGTQSGLAIRARKVRAPNMLLIADAAADVEPPPPPPPRGRRSVLNLLVHVLDRRGDEVNDAFVSATLLGKQRLRLDRAHSLPLTGRVERGHASIVFRRLDDKVLTGTRLVFRIRVTGGGPHTSVSRRIAVVVNARR